MNEERLRLLVADYQNGCEESGKELTELLCPLVSALAARLSDYRFDREDLYQAGMIGLIKAARRFNLAAGTRFTTFAAAWIQGEMRAYRRAHSWPVKVSRALWEQASRLHAMHRRLFQALGREPTIHELAGAMGITAEEAALVMESGVSLFELNEEITADSGGGTEEDRLVDRLTLQEGMIRLNPVEQQVIRLRYFEDKTQVQIAGILSLSQRQVSRLEKRALSRLKGFLQS
jgi:RNA polymerase sporulation-specific sigma factor